MLRACICVLNVSGFLFDLLGHLVTTHFCTSKSIPTHLHYLSSLFSWICNDWRLFAVIAKSSAYVAELNVIFDVPNVYPLLPVCNHLSDGSKKIKKRYGLSVSLCMVPLYIGIGIVFPKCSPVNIVLECEYIFPISVTASSG